MKLLHPLPPSLGPFHPAVLIATWFWSGRIGFASGSWGSLAALPFAAAIAWLAGPLALIPAAALLFALGVWASGHYADANDISDPSPVVVDDPGGHPARPDPLCRRVLLLPAFRRLEAVSRELGRQESQRRDRYHDR